MRSISLDDKNYPVEPVIEALSPQVTPERLQRIEDVLNRRCKHLVPVLENVYDRGNTSAVMRSAEAFGFYNIHHIVGIDEFKESRRVTKGAQKWLVQEQWRNSATCVKHLKEQGYRIYVTQLEGGKPIDQVSFEQPVALCFGSERDGVSPELTDLADERVYVPMHGFVQSFNISVAAALCFQTASREIRKHNIPPVPDIERQRLLALYLYRSIKTPILGSIPFSE